jgi:hypothetical protein
LRLLLPPKSHVSAVPVTAATSASACYTISRPVPQLPPLDLRSTCRAVQHSRQLVSVVCEGGGTWILSLDTHLCSSHTTCTPQPVRLLMVWWLHTRAVHNSGGSRGGWHVNLQRGQPRPLPPHLP